MANIYQATASFLIAISGIAVWLPDIYEVPQKAHSLRKQIVSETQQFQKLRFTLNTDRFADGLSVFKSHKGRNGHDIVFHRKIHGLVNVNLYNIKGVIGLG